jgi:O-antigen/teichoic acid export membrane protein
MVFHTNIVSYARLAMTQLPTLLLGAIAGAAQVGVYKIAMAIAAGVGRVGDPAMAAILPRLAKLWSSRQYRAATLLVYRASAGAFVLLASAAALVILFRSELGTLIVGASPPERIGTIVVIASIAQIINGVFFWNAQALFASHRARVVGTVVSAGAVLQIATLGLLASSEGAKGAAVALLLAQIFINFLLTPIALWVFHRAEPAADDERNDALNGGPERREALLRL